MANAALIDKEARIKAVRRFMKDSGIDGLVVSSWQNVFYLSGFTGFDDATLLVTAEHRYIITDSRYYVQAEEQSGDFELVKGYCRALGLMKDLIEKEGLKTVGFENLTVRYDSYENYFKNLGAELIPVGNYFLTARRVKSAEEISRVEAACDLASEALVKTLPYVKPGVTEIEVAARLEYEMRKLGADKPSFETIIASGVRGSMPHGTATSKVIEKGDGVTIDFGAFYKGMCSDMTRTVFVGEPSPKLREIYGIVKEAQEAAINGYKPGMKGKDLDKIARDVIDSRGYGEYFGHSLGHGVGIDIHEDVPVSQGGELVLTPGMVFSIEPGIYIPDVGGVRIEDLVTIENDRLRMVTKSPTTELTVL